MSRKAHIPEARVLNYALDSETGWYCLTDSPAGFDLIPSRLKVEPTRRPDIIRASHVIHGPVKGGNYTFITGLRPCPAPGVFYGDALSGNGKRSFILFQFTEARKRLRIDFFNAYNVYPNRRATFVKTYLQGRV